MGDEKPPVERGIIGWENKIGPRDLLAAGTAMVIVIGYVLTSSGKADQTARDLSTFQASINATIAEIRTEMRTGIASIRSDISLLPDYRARLTAVERRLAEGDARDTAQDTNIARIDRLAIENRADINNLRAASGVSLPNAPGVRR